MADYEWVVGETVEGLDGRAGILGMSTGLFVADSLPDTLLIQELANDAIITDPVFGFALYGTAKQSFVDIGVLQASSMENPDDMVWLDVAYDTVFFWAQTTSGVRFNEDDDEAYYLTPSYSFTDTGTSCMYLTTDKYSSITTYLFENNESSYYVVFDDGTFATTCDTLENWPTIELLFGGYWIMSTPEDYFIELDEN